LVKVAQRLELADFLQYGHAGKGAINRLLADAVEALFAAVYLDAGIDVAKQVIIRQLDEMFSSGDVDFKKDAKTALQECLQARRLALPTYAVHAVRQSVYTIACTVPTLALESFGDGTTRKAAEQEAAKKMLRLLPQ
jgi:ribonuclease-3